MNREKFVPNLRFHEFGDEWVEKKLSEIGEVQDGSHETPQYFEEGVPFIRLQNIERNKFIYDDIKYISVEKAKQLKRHSFQAGDILFNKLGNPIGKTTIAPSDIKSGIMVSDVVKIRPNEFFNYKFVMEFLNSPRTEKEIKIEMTGSTRKRLNLAQVKNLKIVYPNTEEQNKIADFLDMINKKIGLLEKKIVLYQKYKLGITDNILKKYSENEYIKLKDICLINKGKQLNKSDMIEQGKYYVLNGGKEPSGYTDSWNVDENTITISEGGNSCGYVSFNKEKFYCGGHCYYLTLKSKDFESNYLFHYLKFIEPKIMLLRVGSGLPNIQKGDIENIKVLQMDILKQKEIGNFLDLIDKNILLTMQQKENMMIFKNGLLQKMFI